ncbi:MAG: putative NEK protein kinase [Streblomastix strix]|uniref:non-specific serine/threonine protein kinase n=1 Tax=Streblomastix strix TaxID=222440 RepID=A0A5J4WHP7_9EUKA|nr:MAG: putative NEK protein kinase [Streblomastix strix]
MIRDYEVIKACGKGGFGKAYIVKKRGANRKYVIKQMQYKKESEEQQIQHEIEIHKNLHSPFIVDFVESFQTDDDMWNIVMEFCEGGDLDDFLEDLKEMGAELDEDRAWDLLSQMVMAIDYLHQNKILHRDLKPKNVFLSSTFDVRLGDFGISRVMKDGEEYARTQTGSLAYMCPELLTKAKFNEKGDVWGIGMIMYELLTGLLFTCQGKTQSEVMQIIISKREPEITNYYSQKLRDVIHKMLIKEYHDRVSITQLKQEEEIRKRMVKYGNELLQRGLPTQDNMARNYIMSVVNMGQSRSNPPPPPNLLASAALATQGAQRTQLGGPVRFDIPYPNLARLDPRNPAIVYALQDKRRATVTISPDVCVGLGIVQCEVRFSDPQGRGYRWFGIVESNYPIPENYFPGQDAHSLGYCGADGTLNRKERSNQNETYVEGNKNFDNGEIVKAEAVMDPNPEKRSIRFFVKGEEQPLYYTNIPANFKFCIQRYYSQQAAEVVSFRQVGSPQGGHLPAAVMFKWQMN